VTEERKVFENKTHRQTYEEKQFSLELTTKGTSFSTKENQR
jgi:hypothetical protein